MSDDRTLAIAPVAGGTGRKPRETIELAARWSLPDAPRSLEARLIWFTRGKGTDDAGVVATETLTPLEPQGSRRVRFTLPDAPYSFSGALITLTWAVELVADDAAARWEFVMAPDGREIALPDTPNGARAR
jgi:hypothetical protein